MENKRKTGGEDGGEGRRREGRGERRKGERREDERDEKGVGIWRESS